MNKQIWLCVSVLFVVACAARAVEGPRPIHVLFLGHEGKNHDSSTYCPMLMERFGEDAIYFDYETDPAVALRPERLAHYDAVLLYANHDNIAPGPYKALMDYVEGGGGFVPVHCASYCFRNEEGFVRLVGAQFKSHGWKEFTARILKPDHAAMKDVKEYTSLDETYIHHKHGTDREILMERVEDGHHEPWTWTRTQGKGRVFYTAGGHDHHTWSNPGFQQLLKSGILWAVGDEVRAHYETFLAARPKKIYERREFIPNYERRPEPLKFQYPLPPETSQAYTHVMADFDMQLFADEADLGGQPIAFTWDEHGRCWVAVTVDYPNTIAEDGAGNDQILILEDTNNDGRADNITVFADKLNIPTGITLHKGGAIVAAAPHFLYLKDTDGDGKADVRERIFEDTWGKGDTHAGPSSLRYGIDNWMYGCVGYSRFKGTIDGKKHDFGQGVFRYQPDGSAMEFLHQFSNNSWAFGQNAVGDTFGGTANNAPSFFCGVPETIGGVQKRRISARKINVQDKMHPITPNIRQVDVFGGYTAAAGHVFIGGDGLPDRLQDVALICEPTGGLVAILKTKRTPSGYTGLDGFNLVASNDEWFSPVAAEVGPDGAVWVLDFYNFIIQHNPTPNPGRGGFEGVNGAGNAHENPNRDNNHGRIWRVVWKDSTAKKPSSLIDALSDRNPFWRNTAQRLLVESQDRSALPALRALAADHTQPVAAIHALWTLKGLGALDTDLHRQALTSVNADVRRNAVRALDENETGSRLFFESAVISDPDLMTRTAAVIKLAAFPSSPELQLAARRVASDPVNNKDEWLKIAVQALRDAHGITETVASGFKITGPNLIPNPSFEEADAAGNPAGWRYVAHSGSGTHEWVDNRAKDGSKSLKLTGIPAGDISWQTSVKVKPNTQYRLAGWIRTENVKGAMGALFNVHELGRDTVMEALNGHKDWTRVELDFQSGSHSSFRIHCLLGGWGQSSGTAWYDHVSLHELVPAESTATGVVKLEPGNPALGREIFFKHPTAACIHCHVLEGSGSPIGPALDGIAARKDAAYIEQSLLEPNAVIAEGYPFEASPMPPLGILLSPQEIEHVKAFLGTLK
jgi:uncharacterized protein